MFKHFPSISPRSVTPATTTLIVAQFTLFLHFQPHSAKDKPAGLHLP
jgi:hypothetical protein